MPRGALGDTQKVSHNKGLYAIIVVTEFQGRPRSVDPYYYEYPVLAAKAADSKRDTRLRDQS